MNDELIKQIQSSIESCETIIRLEQLTIDGLRKKLEKLKEPSKAINYPNGKNFETGY